MGMVKDKPGFIRLLDSFVTLCRAEALGCWDGNVLIRSSVDDCRHLEREANRAEDRMVDLLEGDP